MTNQTASFDEPQVKKNFPIRDDYREIEFGENISRGTTIFDRYSLAKRIFLGWKDDANIWVAGEYTDWEESFYWFVMEK